MPTLLGVLLLLATSSLPVRPAESEYEKDVAFALQEIEKKCSGFIAAKKIDWKKVSAEMTKAAKSVKSPEEHLLLLTRMIARLRDGHAEVRPLEKGQGIRAPEELRGEREGPGMCWCRIGKDYYVKNAFGAAAAAGVKAGDKLVKVNGKSADKWVADRMAQLADLKSFSTDQHALFFTLNGGLYDAPGTRYALELLAPDGKKKSKTVACDKAGAAPLFGPAFPPEGIVTQGDLSYGKTKSGFGYVHIRRSAGDLPAKMDAALATLKDAPGLILDYRGNSGGGFDHDAFMGEFIPKGKIMDFGAEYRSEGKTPYGGPIVVIVNGTVVSAGETGCGAFKEDGRAYMIGESPTAGMASQKETIELPSRLFALFVSVHSNKARFNGGKGIEGVGVIPHETLELKARDLADGRDTLIERAEAILRDFPQASVLYDPKAFGWGN